MNSIPKHGSLGLDFKQYIKAEVEKTLTATRKKAQAEEEAKAREAMTEALNQSSVFNNLNQKKN